MEQPYIHPQFCIVEYRSKQWKSVEDKSNLILVAIFAVDDDDKFKLQVFFDPQWRKFVHEKDKAYIESLLMDAEERLHRDAEMLFTQLCSLGVGPVVSIEVGTNFSESPSRLSLLEALVELRPSD